MRRIVYPRCSCGGAMRPARDVAPEEEERANAKEPAAILACERCQGRIVLPQSKTLTEEIKKP